MLEIWIGELMQEPAGRKMHTKTVIFMRAQGNWDVRRKKRVKNRGERRLPAPVGVWVGRLWVGGGWVTWLKHTFHVRVQL